MSRSIVPAVQGVRLARVAWAVAALGLTLGSAAARAEEPAAAASQPQAASAATGDEQLREAALAVEQQIGVPPFNGPVAVRPPFVSEMEWTALRQVASQREGSERELTRMVNHLRYMKQLDLWRHAPASLPVAKREALVKQLLDELPMRVANSEMDRPMATKLQAELVEKLVADPAARARRLKAEGKRLAGPPAAKQEADASPGKV